MPALDEDAFGFIDSRGGGFNNNNDGTDYSYTNNRNQPNYYPRNPAPMQQHMAEPQDEYEDQSLMPNGDAGFGGGGHGGGSGMGWNGHQASDGSFPPDSPSFQRQTPQSVPHHQSAYQGQAYQDYGDDFGDDMDVEQAMLSVPDGQYNNGSWMTAGQYMMNGGGNQGNFAPVMGQQGVNSQYPQQGGNSRISYPSIAQPGLSSNAVAEPRGVVRAPESHGIRLIPVRNLPDKHQRIFKFQNFNAVQSKVFNSAYETDDNLVVASPTGSGKTAIFELAILRMAGTTSTDLTAQSSRKLAVYLAPTKALCSERYRDWNARFAQLGMKCLVFTGDTMETRGLSYESKHVDIIITTPEKWDSVTRKASQNGKVLQRLALLMIDEVHILHDTRGATLEVVVSRMRTANANIPIRIVALSATVPNVEDVARWLRPLTASTTAIYEAGGSTLGASATNSRLRMPLAKVYKFGEAFRPSRLDKAVLSYSSGANAFAFSKRVENEVYGVIGRYGKGKPVLVFCATRKGCKFLATTLHKRYEEDLQRGRSLPWMADKRAGSGNFVDKSLGELAACGIAIHHAGVDNMDRHTVEDGYRNGSIMVVVATSTLAVGVNMPAFTVILAGTKSWNGSAMVEYEDLEVQQMMGRAGRPCYDTHGQVVIMCEQAQEQKWKDCVESKTVLESCLHTALKEHIVSEVSLGTIRNIETAKEWIRSTFLHIRIQQKPEHYASALSGSTVLEGSWQDKLDDFVKNALYELQERQLLIMEAEGERTPPLPLDQRPLRATAFGEIMTAGCLDSGTMQRVLEMSDNESVESLLHILAAATEFAELRWRSGEKTLYRKVNKCVDLRYPLHDQSKMDVSDRVYMMIQIRLGAINLEQFKEEKTYYDTNMRSELGTIWKSATRISRAMVKVAAERRFGGTMMSVLELHRSLSGMAWEDSPAIFSQIDSLGQKSIQVLGGSGIRTFEAFRRQPPEALAQILQRNLGKLVETVKKFPSFRIRIKQTGSSLSNGTSPVRVDFDVQIEVKGLLEEKLGKKSGGIRDKYVTFLAILSDGTYVAYRSIKAKNFKEDTRKIQLSVDLTKQSQKLQVVVSVDEIAGCTTLEVFNPRLPASAFPEPEEPEATVVASVNDEDTSRPDKEQPVVPNNQTLRPTILTVAPPAEPERLPNGNWKCAHKCKKCSHQCCREGSKKRPKKQTVAFGKTGSRALVVEDTVDSGAELEEVDETPAVAARANERARPKPKQRQTDAEQSAAAEMIDLSNYETYPQEDEELPPLDQQLGRPEQTENRKERTVQPSQGASTQYFDDSLDDLIGELPSTHTAADNLKRKRPVVQSDESGDDDPPRAGTTQGGPKRARIADEEEDSVESAPARLHQSDWDSSSIAPEDEVSEAPAREDGRSHGHAESDTIAPPRSPSPERNLNDAEREDSLFYPASPMNSAQDPASPGVGNAVDGGGNGAYTVENSQTGVNNAVKAIQIGQNLEVALPVPIEETPDKPDFDMEDLADFSKYIEQDEEEDEPNCYTAPAKQIEKHTDLPRNDLLSTSMAATGKNSASELQEPLPAAWTPQRDLQDNLDQAEDGYQTGGDDDMAWETTHPHPQAAQLLAPVADNVLREDLVPASAGEEAYDADQNLGHSNIGGQHETITSQAKSTTRSINIPRSPFLIFKPPVEAVSVAIPVQPALVEQPEPAEAIPTPMTEAQTKPKPKPFVSTGAALLDEWLANGEIEVEDDDDEEME